MILVLSEEHDISTDYFMEWCNYLDIRVVRLNKQESINILANASINPNGVVINFNTENLHFSLSDIDAVWFRRGRINHYPGIAFQDPGNANIAFLQNEGETLNEFIYDNLRSKYCIGDPHKYNANKLIALSAAVSSGLLIPDTYISKKSEEIQNHYGEREIITKAIQDRLNMEFNGNIFFSKVTTVQDHGYSEFYYSKFQEKINKKYELRVFFIGDEYYPAAIFSNNKFHDELFDSHEERPRAVPYILPEEILDKLKKFSAIMKFDTGSYDILVDKNDRYYFLEINPVGQYDHISKLCNYYIDKKIADHFKLALHEQQ